MAPVVLVAPVVGVYHNNAITTMWACIIGWMYDEKTSIATDADASLHALPVIALIKLLPIVVISLRSLAVQFVGRDFWRACLRA